MGFSECIGNLVCHYVEEGGPPLQWATPRTSDGSGRDHMNPEDLLILLPSTLKWKWCIDHGVKSLAVKEARLWIAQANESIHKICLALGFKSDIFHTQVKTANSQQNKACAWNAVKSGHNCPWACTHIQPCMWCLSGNLPGFAQNSGPSATCSTWSPCCHTNLGSDKVGQCNKQQTQIWGFGQMSEDDGTWMDDCK